ncbi:MAG: hypothetical protein ACJASQ_004323 [Crocinitomicaceae bacterium]|jgi:hypothetical protein
MSEHLKYESEINSLKQFLFEDEFENRVNEFYDNVRNAIKLENFISSVFITCKGSSARSFILNINKVIEILEYDHLIRAFVNLKNDELAVYYFTRFLAEDLKINPYGILDTHPELIDAHAFVNKALPVVKITLQESSEVPPEMDILLRRLKSQGAPML